MPVVVLPTAESTIPRADAFSAILESWKIAISLRSQVNFVPDRFRWHGNGSSGQHRFMAVRWLCRLVAGLVVIGTVVIGTVGQASAQSLTAGAHSNADIDNGIVAAVAAMDSARSIARLAEKIKDLAQQAQRGVTAPHILADQAASLGQQVDILAQDAAFNGIDLIGPGARAHSVTLPSRRKQKIPAMALTSSALKLSRFDFGSATGIGSAVARSDAALARAKKAAATYAGHAKALRAQRPSGAIGSRPAAAPLTGGTRATGGLDIDALHNRLGIKK